MAVVDTKYPSGQQALFFNEDGSGFAYYKSGKVAACVSKVNDYQNSFYFYENDRRSTLLCSLDEQMVGWALENTGLHECMVPGCVSTKEEAGPCGGFSEFIGKHNLCRFCPHTKPEHRAGEKMNLSLVGGSINDEFGTIKQYWKWDRHRQDPGVMPNEPVEIRLNKHLKFKFIDRDHCTVEFRSDGIQRVFDCGLKLRRTKSYIDGAAGKIRVPFGPLRGKVLVDVDTPSLIQRQREAIEASAALKSRLNPTSGSLTNTHIRGVVAGLEQQFSGYIDSLHATTFADKGWREDALIKTLDEIPRIQRTGFETGDFPGFGNTIYGNGSDQELFNATAPGALTASGAAVLNSTHSSVRASSAAAGTGRNVSRTKKSNGQWLGELDLRELLRAENPMLPRAEFLMSASGRYNCDIPVQTPQRHGLALPAVHARDLAIYAKQSVNPSQLLVALCLREDDTVASHALLRVAEQVHADVAAAESDGTASVASGREAGAFKMVRVEMAEGRELVKKYNIRAVPTVILDRVRPLAVV